MPPGKKMKGLEIVIGKAPKTLGAGASKEESSDDMGSSVFGEYADDAFDAIKSGNKAAFSAALKSAIGACGSYGDDSEE